MIEREVGDTTAFLGTCSCQKGILLFAYGPVWILYLPCCEILKGHSFLTVYKLTILFNVGDGKIFLNNHSQQSSVVAWGGIDG